LISFIFHLEYNTKQIQEKEVYEDIQSVSEKQEPQVQSVPESEPEKAPDVKEKKEKQRKSKFQDVPDEEEIDPLDAFMMELESKIMFYSSNL
jgi:hypothetical protein